MALTFIHCVAAQKAENIISTSAQISEFIPAAPSSRGTGWQIPAHVWVGVGGVTSNLERASMFHAYIVDEVHGIVNLRRLFCPV